MLTNIQEIVIFLFGIATALSGAYLKMKGSGETIYPVEKIEAGKAKIQALTESNEYLSRVVELFREISEDEVRAILAKAKDLENTHGISAEQKAIVIGTMFFEAMKKPEQ